MMPSKFSLNFWNGEYYCRVTMPDGNRVELKSGTDLTYTQWKEKIKNLWEESQSLPETVESCICPVCEASFICPNRRI